MNKPYTQFRIARPTQFPDKIKQFYECGLELIRIGEFSDHEGINGFMLGVPDATCHLEFTYHGNSYPCQPPSNDNLLVFYYPNREIRDHFANKLTSLGFKVVEPENPYWKAEGITIEDPDKWRVVLMAVPGFSIS